MTHAVLIHVLMVARVVFFGELVISVLVNLDTMVHGVSVSPTPIYRYTEIRYENDTKETSQNNIVPNPLYIAQAS